MDAYKSRLFESPYHIESKDNIELEIVFNLQRKYGEHKLLVILQSMPGNLKQVSIKCGVRIEVMDSNMSGVVGDNQNKSMNKYS